MRSGNFGYAGREREAAKVIGGGGEVVNTYITRREALYPGSQQPSRERASYVHSSIHPSNLNILDAIDYTHPETHSLVTRNRNDGIPRISTIPLSPFVLERTAVDSAYPGLHSPTRRWRRGRQRRSAITRRAGSDASCVQSLAFLRLFIRR